MSEAPSIFVLDDDSEICELIAATAVKMGFSADFVTQSELFPAIYHPGIDIVFLDLSMPGMDGIEIIRFLSENQSTAALVLISAHEISVLNAVRDLALNHGLSVHAILTKPVLMHELSDVFDDLIRGDYNKSRGGDIDHSLSKSGSNELPSVEELKLAITGKDISVSYQPKIGIEGDDDYIVGFEGLARWRHWEKGAIPPDYFIALAEEHDLIKDLTEHIMDLVTDDINNNPSIFEDMNVSINISEKLLNDLTLPETLISNISSKSLMSENFTFEITENTTEADPQSSLDVLTRFRLKGVTLSIDDFGTGHSSLTRLRKAPFTEIKVDKSFIENFDSDDENRIIVENTISLAKSLSLKVVAEGVEKQVHLDLLKDLRCDVAQGYFLGRPMAVEKLATWAEDWRGSPEV